MATSMRFFQADDFETRQMLIELLRLAHSHKPNDQNRLTELLKTEAAQKAIHHHPNLTFLFEHSNRTMHPN